MSNEHYSCILSINLTCSLTSSHMYIMHYDDCHSHPFFFPILVNSPFSLQILPHFHVVLFCFGATEFKQDHLNMGIELANGAWWTHQWLHKERQCRFFIQNLLVKNSSGCGTLLSLSLSTIDWDKPSLAEASVSHKKLL